LAERHAELFARRIDSKACRRQVSQTRLPTSVREDVNAHVSSQGVVAEDPGRGLQGGMPCQAAPLQQRHSFIVNDPHHLQMPFHLYKCLTQTCTIIAGNWLQAAFHLLYTEMLRKLGTNLDHLKFSFLFVQTSMSQ